jgi:outer membrane protein TolC
MNFRTTLFMIASSLAALSPSHAFSTSSSFTRRLPSSSPTHVSTSSPYRSTALSMNLFDRFQRVAKANINNVLKSLEDPEKIMSQALEDMQVSINDQYYDIIVAFFIYSVLNVI